MRPAPTYAELLAGQAPDAATLAAILRGAEPEPLVVRIFAGIGAWVSAALFFGLLAVSDLLNQAGGCFVVGALLVTAGLFAAPPTKPPFVRQVGLAALLTGDLAICAGAAMSTSGGWLEAAFVAQLLLTAALYVPSRNQAFRFLAPMAAVVLVPCLLYDRDGSGYLHVLIGALAITFGALSLPSQRPPVLDPLANATAIGMPVALFVFESMRTNLLGREDGTPMWPSGLLTGGLLVALLAHVAGSTERMQRPALLLAAGAALALGTFTYPGIPIAIALVTFGVWNGDRALPILGIGYLPVALFVFYRSLAVDLATKGWIVLGSGALLLALLLLFSTVARGRRTP